MRDEANQITFLLMYVAVHLKIDQNEGFVYKRSKLKDKGEYYTLKHASGDFHLFFFYQ